jgi:hypothetical protein
MNKANKKFVLNQEILLWDHKLHLCCMGEEPVHSNQESVNVHRGMNELKNLCLIITIYSAHSRNPALFLCFIPVMPGGSVFQSSSEMPALQKFIIYQNASCGVCRREYLPPELYISC